MTKIIIKSCPYCKEETTYPSRENKGYRECNCGAKWKPKEIIYD